MMLDEKSENAKKSEMLMGLLQLSYNRTCADCGFIIGEGLVKANAALGVFICLYCSECHTAVLPLSICAIKSVDGYSMNMRLARWSYNEIRFMARWGNKRANAYWGATLPPNPSWGNHRFTTKVHRENHIKAKYKLKTWVIPKSSSSFNDYVDAELRILNDQGYSYRTAHPRSSLRYSSDLSSTVTVTPVLASVMPGDAMPTKPSVRLPPQHEMPTENALPAFESPSSFTKQIGEEHARNGEKLMSLPGVGWSIKWKEKTGMDSVASENLKEHALEKENRDLKDLPRSTLFEISPYKVRSATSLGPRGKTQYRVNIPPLTARQQNIMSYTRHSIPSSNTVTKPQGALGSLRYVSASGSAVASLRLQPQATSQGRLSSAIVPSGQKYGPDNDVGEMYYIQKEPKTSDEHQKSMIDLAWDGLLPVSGPFDRREVAGTVPAIHGSQSVLGATPIFPFLHTTDMDTFSFHPTLPHASSNPFFGDTTSNLFYNSRNTCHNTNLPVSDSVAWPPNQSVHHVPKSYTPCYEWNYYLACSEKKDGECQKTHICEICASSEHRAAQHWHHLATAPLPEIQIQPKLSTPTAPPESPTLSAIKDRVPLFVPAYSIDSFDQSSLKSPRVPLFVPPLVGLEKSQKAAAQLERLKRRKILARSKSAPPTDAQASGPEGVVTKGQSPRKNQRIAIMAPSTSPFDKPVEVILPPQVRPFQSQEANNAGLGSDAVDNASPIGKLRVTAPAFEPSHTGAWIPFSSPTNQFEGLFQIPSKQNRKIEIVAPKNKGKEVVRDNGTEKTKTGSNDNKKRSNKSETQSGNSTNIKHESASANLLQSKPSLMPAFEERMGAKSKQPSFNTFADLDWSVPGPSAPCPTSAATAIYLRNLSRSPIHARRSSQMDMSAKTAECLSNISNTSFPSDKLDNNVLKILDEQLDAIIGKESEETIAATLETIIEICSTPSTETSPHNAHFGEIPNPRGESTSHSTTWPWHESQNSHANYCFFLVNDFADDNAFRSKSHVERPRSSDSSSTTPETSPESPAGLVDQTPLNGRIERMMSCAASNGTGQCNCGLGDWFHHSQA